ncbi:hypothetical protein ACTNF7_004348 [Citrobacter braakii]
MSETKNITPFSQQLAYINKGTLDAELTEALTIEVPPAMQAEITSILREFRHEADGVTS